MPALQKAGMTWHGPIALPGFFDFYTWLVIYCFKDIFQSPMQLYLTDYTLIIRNRLLVNSFDKCISLFQYTVFIFDTVCFYKALELVLQGFDIVT